MVMGAIITSCAIRIDGGFLLGDGIIFPRIFANLREFEIDIRVNSRRLADKNKRPWKIQRRL
jgi:hypothetical protein